VILNWRENRDLDHAEKSVIEPGRRTRRRDPPGNGVETLDQYLDLYNDKGCFEKDEVGACSIPTVWPLRECGAIPKARTLNVI
jgi:hypothetical protein